MCMVYTDPYDPDQPYVTCLECGFRETGDYTACPNCDGRVRNIAVPRE